MKNKKPLSEMLSFKGRKVIITGASSGIGRVIAERFAEAGAELILLDIDEKGLFEVKECFKNKCKTTLYKIDLSNKKEVDILWDKIGKKLPDVLINNAGIYPFKDYLEIDEKFLAKILDINLNSVFWMCQNFIKRRIDKGGVIVNISSIEAILPFKEGLAPYGISKAGVIALTRSLARDYGKKGFRINTILPGGVLTPGTNKAAKEAIKKLDFSLIKTGYDFKQRLVLGRLGDPDDIAKVVLFLSSDLASYIQGALIPVDGGFLSA